MQHTPHTILAGLIGNIVEWYDFALYGYFAVILSTLFFPGDAALASLIATYGIFAAGFLMRPIGALLFGVIGDRYGRRVSLFISVALMGSATFALGLLPTHATFGVGAAVLLVAVRLLQGLSVGGEFSTSATYMIENANQHKRGFVGSFANIGSIAGTLLGSAVAAITLALLPHDTVVAWGWRIPFLFGGVIGVVALWLRRHLPESPIFAQTVDRSQSPLHILIHENRRELVLGTLFAAGYAVAFYILLVYLPSYVHTNFGMPLATALWLNALALGGMLPLILAFSYLSDRLIRRRTLLLFTLAFLLFVTLPCFYLLQFSSAWVVGILQFLFATAMAAVLGVAPALFVELFPTKDRLTAYSLTFNGAFGIFGGTAPLVATWLIEFTNHPVAPALYLCLGLLTAFGAVYYMHDRSREPLL